MQARKESARAQPGAESPGTEPTKPLLSTGAVSEVDILRLDREVSRSRGEVEQASAQISRVQAAIREAQRKVQETELTFRNEARRDLAEVMGKLNALSEGAVALHDKVDKSQVKSPVRGRVQRLLANTVGGVVRRARTSWRSFRSTTSSCSRPRCSRRTSPSSTPASMPRVKFTAYDFSIYGGLDAAVENISPDTIVDERGNAFYLVRVRTDKPNFSAKMPIIPGMTAEVDILTGNKTVHVVPAEAGPQGTRLRADRALRADRTRRSRMADLRSDATGCLGHVGGGTGLAAR